MTSLPLRKAEWGINADGRCRSSNRTDQRVAVVVAEANRRRCHMEMRRLEEGVEEAGKLIWMILNDGCCRILALHFADRFPHFRSCLTS